MATVEIEVSMFDRFPVVLEIPQICVINLLTAIEWVTDHIIPNDLKLSQLICSVKFSKHDHPNQDLHSQRCHSHPDSAYRIQRFQNGS